MTTRGFKDRGGGVLIPLYKGQDHTHLYLTGTEFIKYGKTRFAGFFFNHQTKNDKS